MGGNSIKNVELSVGSIWGNIVSNPPNLVVNDEYFGKTQHFPGSFVYRDKNNVITRASIERVIYCNPATVIKWDDGSCTVCKCFDGDVYDPETGLAICILKKIVGPSAVRDVIKSWLPKAKYLHGEQVVQTLKDVRKEEKKSN